MRTFFSIIVLVFFIFAAVSSESSSSFTNSGSSYSSDAYSTPSRPNSGICAACGGKGYIMRNGQRETCVCGGSGKAVSFPSN